MKTNYSLILLLLLIPFLVKAQGVPSMYENVNAAVVTVYSQKSMTKLTPDGQPRTISKISQLGSGFMISDYEIITAANLVQLSELVSVKFLDGSIVPAKVVGLNPSADIAMIRLNNPRYNAVHVKLGNSNNVNHGERVFIVVAPEDLDHSISVGAVKKVIKSTTDKEVNTIDYYQITAKIESSYSGGPMFNMDGNVIGVVSHMLSEAEGFASIPYVITSNIVKDLLVGKEMIWEGMDLRSLTAASAKRYDLPQSSGLLVEKIAKKSALANFGVQKEDIILSANGIEVKDNKESLSRIEDLSSNIKEGDPLEMMIIRGEKLVFLNNDDY